MSARRHIPVAAPTLGERETEYVLDCLRSTWISSKGEYLDRFEERFRAFAGARHAVACNNGTSALHLALLALGVGPGDEVIVPTLTFVASANAVRYCGATPRFADSLPGSWNLDPADVERKIGPATKAVMAVHLYGCPAALDELLAVADRHGIALVEDAAEAHGALYHGRPVGALGAVGTFSFYGNKIITTGEGGMVVTNDEEIDRSARLHRGQGQDPERTYWFPVVGFNYRMTNIQAAIGLAQLEGVDAELTRRREIAARYRANLVGLPITFQETDDDSRSAHWMVGVILPVSSGEERDAIASALLEDLIETRPFFYPLHTLPPYVDAAHGDLPIATDLAMRGICLPTWGGLSDDEIDYVCERMARVVGMGAAAESNGTVRRLSGRDATAVADFFRDLGQRQEITRHFHPHGWDDATASRVASHEGADVYLGYFASGRLVGYAMLRGWDEGYDKPSFGVAVHPEHQGHGVGSQLLSECIQLARDRGATTVMLKVHKDNQRASSWYRTAGFEIVGSTEDGQWICELSLA